jgi:two-component system, OmpR family, alkaline phosphatase synthesis response regulator PhoP
MHKAVVLAVEDEEDILQIIEYNLGRDGYKVVRAETGEQALAQIGQTLPDLVILDLMLPGIDGLDVCRQIKSNAQTSQIPVLMLTARSEEADMVSGLEMGADDYVTKPFSPRVLSARVKALLRRKRGPNPQEQIIRYGDLAVFTEQHQVRVDEEDVELTATEFRILTILMRRPGWVFSREQIVDNIQGASSDVTSRSVDVHIVSLRRKLGNCGDYIETVRGVGYRFKAIAHE